MNKVIRRSQWGGNCPDPLANPGEAIHHAIMEAGQHAMKFVTKSGELVEKWWQPEQFGDVNFN